MAKGYNPELKHRKSKAKRWKAFAEKRKFAFFARTKEARDLTTQDKSDDDQDKLRTVDTRDP